MSFLCLRICPHKQLFCIFTCIHFIGYVLLWWEELSFVQLTNVAYSLKSFCGQPIDDWQTQLNSLLVSCKECTNVSGSEANSSKSTVDLYKNDWRLNLAWGVPGVEENWQKQYTRLRSCILVKLCLHNTLSIIIAIVIDYAISALNTSMVT